MYDCNLWTEVTSQFDFISDYDHDVFCLKKTMMLLNIMVYTIKEVSGWGGWQRKAGEEALGLVKCLHRTSIRKVQFYPMVMSLCYSICFNQQILANLGTHWTALMIVYSLLGSLDKEFMFYCWHLPELFWPEVLNLLPCFRIILSCSCGKSASLQLKTTHKKHTYKNVLHVWQNKI